MVEINLNVSGWGKGEKKKGCFSVPKAIALEKRNNESVLSSAVSKINWELNCLMSFIEVYAHFKSFSSLS